MYEYVLDGNGQWSLGDILYLATSWIPALDGVPPPPVVKSKDTSTYHSHLTLSTAGDNGAMVQCKRFGLGGNIE